jgi:hypothetical protein
VFGYVKDVLDRLLAGETDYEARRLAAGPSRGRTHVPRRGAGGPCGCEKAPPGTAKGVAEVAATRLCSPVTRQGKGVAVACAHFVTAVAAGEAPTERLFPDDDRSSHLLAEHPALAWKLKNVRRYREKRTGTTAIRGRRQGAFAPHPACRHSLVSTVDRRPSRIKALAAAEGSLDPLAFAVDLFGCRAESFENPRGKREGHLALGRKHIFRPCLSQPR